MKKKPKGSEYLSYIQHGGYIVVQDKDYNVIVSKDGRQILLSSFHKRLTDEELRDHVDFVRGIEIRADNL
jgi:hypothetical protein